MFGFQDGRKRLGDRLSSCSQSRLAISRRICSLAILSKACRMAAAASPIVAVSSGMPSTAAISAAVFPAAPAWVIARACQTLAGETTALP